MDTALTVFSVGQVKWGGRHDPYKEQWPIQLIRGIVRWRPNSNAVDIASDDDSGDDDDQGGTAIEREGEEKDGKGEGEAVLRIRSVVGRKKRSRIMTGQLQKQKEMTPV